MTSKGYIKTGESYDGTKDLLYKSRDALKAIISLPKSLFVSSNILLSTLNLNEAVFYQLHSEAVNLIFSDFYHICKTYRDHIIKRVLYFYFSWGSEGMNLDNDLVLNIIKKWLLIHNSEKKMDVKLEMELFTSHNLEQCLIQRKYGLFSTQRSLLKWALLNELNLEILQKGKIANSGAKIVA